MQRHVPALRGQLERNLAPEAARASGHQGHGTKIHASYNPSMGEGQSASLSAQLQQRIRAAMQRNDGWLPFDRFMSMALYEPGLGYYANDSRKFGQMPDSGSDFVTAPEMSPLFGRALAVQVAQALQACDSGEIWEFGAGSGALAAQLLAELGDRVTAYHVIELSATLRERQSLHLQPWAGRVHWHDRLPERIDGVLLGNEVLDAMPVQLLHWDGQRWFERGVCAGDARLRVAGPAHAACGHRRTPSCPARWWRFTPRPRPSCAPWPVTWAGRRRSSSTTASPRPSTTTRSAPAAR